MNFKILLTTTLLSGALIANAQNAGKAYAVTGSAANKYFWANIKQVDLATGKVVKSLFDAETSAFKMNYPAGKSAVNAQDGKPTVYGVAAAALDARHNRLYFAPMHLSEIRYLDLDNENAEFTVVKTNIINSTVPYLNEESHLTRMVIAADGYGYAITNDANHLIRFTTGKKPVVEDLGALVDAESNKTISIHNKCTSWGGDIVADAFGKLIIISANHQIFNIDVNSKIVTHQGAIIGLPATFTTNAAAVDNEGNLVVGSAVVFDGLYKVDTKTWVATKVESNEVAFNASDLATSNMLNQKQYDAKTLFNGNTNNTVYNDVISGSSKVYPNPVTTGEFRVLFDDLATGRYNITVTDLSGKVLFTQAASVASKVQTSKVQVKANLAKGMYFVKVTDASNKLVFTERIVVQ
ncbi:MAG: T9SS type A sorting domain-containing protein [Ferruginibacter sp.]|nr:T9SS type A sorting domain-containing protein [Ferruginibacter sp.]